MKLTIREIKEKADVGDKFDFPAVVKKVYQMQKKEMQYAVGIQNVVVKDDTDEITVGMFIKAEEDAIDKKMEGKKVQVSGEYSTFQKNGKIYKNISKGKILLEEGYSDNEKSQDTPNRSENVQDLKIALLDDKLYMRLKLLEIAVNFLHNQDGVEVRDIIDIAESLENDYMNKHNEQKPINKNSDLVNQAVEKAENLRKQKDLEISDEKAVLIGDITNLIEEKNGFTMVDNIMKAQKVNMLDALDMNKLKAIHNSLIQLESESDIPF